MNTTLSSRIFGRKFFFDGAAVELGFIPVEAIALLTEISVSDSQTISSVETVSLSTSITKEDSQAVSSVETTSLIILSIEKSTSDSQAVSSTETASLSVASDRSDAQAVSSVETASLFINLASNDSQAVSSVEAASLIVVELVPFRRTHVASITRTKTNQIDITRSMQYTTAMVRSKKLQVVLQGKWES